LSCLSPQSLALTAAAALLPACLSSPAAARTAAVDDVGNRVVLETPARRIVSLAPHITETLFAAGAGDRIVATVHHSDYPAAALAIPVIGSYKSISYEALIGLNPDLVIAWASGNGEEIIARIRSLGPAVYLDEPRRIEDIAHSLRRFGRLAGTEATAERKAAAFMAGLAALRGDHEEDEIVDVFYQVWDEPLTTLNGEHLISDIIRLCGGRNVFSDAIPLAPVVSVESVLTADPGVIVVSGMAGERPEWLDRWKDWPGLAAVDDDQLHYIPPDLLQRSSPRVIQGAEMMCGIIERARSAPGSDR